MRTPLLGPRVWLLLAVLRPGSPWTFSPAYARERDGSRRWRMRLIDSLIPAGTAIFAPLPGDAA
jgi:hypothetical protein